KDLFVVQVIGESMNKRIPNGSYCLFKKTIGGSRQGKIVLVEHLKIRDVDFGGNYTVKKYSSKKKYLEDGTWEHKEITLHPDTTAEGYESITLKQEEAGKLKVIAEFVAVIG
ncbi:S24 family peptidase, partial [Thermodesulfobacteriota bacterium]